MIPFLSEACRPRALSGTRASPPPGVPCYGPPATEPAITMTKASRSILPLTIKSRVAHAKRLRLFGGLSFELTNESFLELFIQWRRHIDLLGYSAPLVFASSRP